MADKQNEIERYSEEIAPDQDNFHIVQNGNLYLINFGVNDTALLPQHRKIIDAKVVPFLVNAIRHLGPGTYNLNVVGSASATGKSDHNMDLSSGRAYNAAMYAIKQFEKLQATDTLLQGAVINPNVAYIGDSEASKESKLLKLQQGHVEKKQNHFRAAMFKFKAAIIHPGEASTFSIREIYVFSFTEKSEPLPAALERLKQIDAFPGASMVKDWIAGKTIGKFLELASAEIPGLGPALGHMVSYMVPNDATYCFEIKDYRRSTAKYRFDGLEHKDSWGFFDILEAFSQLKGVAAAIIKVLKMTKDGPEKVEKFQKAYREAAAKFGSVVREYVGNEVADFIDSVVDLADPMTNKWQSMTISASDWTPFMFHDRSAKHSVRDCGGQARRVAVDALLKSAVDLDFAGYVPNNWSDYNASVKIISPFRWSNSMFGNATAKGSMTLL